MHLRPPSVRSMQSTRPIVECAQCFERIYAAEWSEYIDDRHLRHLWACEACGYRFENSGQVPGRRETGRLTHQDFSPRNSRIVAMAASAPFLSLAARTQPPPARSFSMA